MGHRRDVPGYAACLEAFDRRLGDIETAMRPTDFCVITADHGNDPTFRGFDHTREHVPILAFGAGIPPGPIGARASLADVAETIALKLSLPHGTMAGPGPPDLLLRRSATAYMKLVGWLFIAVEWPPCNGEARIARERGNRHNPSPSSG